MAALEEVTQTLETTLDGLRAAHAAVPPPMQPGAAPQPPQQPLTVGDTLRMPNGGVGVVTQIQGDQVTAGPFQWPEGQRPVTRDVFFNGSMSAAMAMQTPQAREQPLT